MIRGKETWLMFFNSSNVGQNSLLFCGSMLYNSPRHHLEESSLIEEYKK